MVLKKDSSILGYPGEISKSMDADHHDVCKYSSTQDHNYIIVRNALKDIACRVRNASEFFQFLNLSKTVPYFTLTDQKLIDAQYSQDTKNIQKLLVVPADRPVEDLLSFHERRTPGTCGWILSAPSFVQWYEKPSKSAILWLHALPASGKSILLSFIINYFAEKDVPCEYYFFRFGDQAKRSLSGCLRSLALQTAVHLPAFREALNALCDTGFKLEKSDAKTIWQKLFVSVLFKISCFTTIYWIIDAIDEADHPQLAVEILTTISASQTPLKAIISSRRSPDLSKIFERSVATSLVHLESMSALENSQDIKGYVEKEMEFMHADPDLKSQIVEKLLSRAGENFLWVRLALEETLQCFTHEDIQDALDSIPAGMEPLYQRMENAITANARPAHKALARKIFAWACCSRRPLHLKELAQALQPLAILDLARTIPQVCGQFVVVDKFSYLTMIHQTAREYLLKTSNTDLSIIATRTHEELFTRCIVFLEEEPHRRRPPAAEERPFLTYAATSWAYHLNLSSAASQGTLTLLVKFLRGHAVLSWISFLANLSQLRILVQASQTLYQFARKRRKYDRNTNPLLHPLIDLEDIESWATDLTKIVGKFGANLTVDPISIFKLIPPFCPKESTIFRQFGKPDTSTSQLYITGLSNHFWDDSLARISLGNGIQAEKILTSGRYFAILTSAGKVILYDNTTFEEVRSLSHEEYVLAIAFSANGNYLASYGFRSTKVWDVMTGKQLYRIENSGGSKALTVTFADNDSSILIGSDDKTIRKAELANAKAGWNVLDPRILKEGVTLTKSPNLMSVDLDATQVAIAYRSFPLSVWSLDPPEVVGRCKRGASVNAWTPVERVTWHPHSGDLLGIYINGHIFKWHPSVGTYQEMNTAESEISCSNEGSLFVTGDGAGNIKLYNFHHFALIYQLSSGMPVTDIIFSADCRRLYDLRGQHCDVWEPNALARFNEVDDRASDSTSAVESAGTSSYISEAWAELRDPITAIGTTSEGPLCLTGNDGGTVFLLNSFTGTSAELWQNPDYMSIEHLDCSKDGSHFACADLGGRVLVKSIVTKTTGQTEQWETQSIFDVRIKIEVGGIKQILLSPASSSLLIVNSSSATLHLTATKAVLVTQPCKNTLTKWVTHPTLKDYLLAFTVSSVAIYRWADLTEVTSIHYAKPISNSEETHKRQTSISGILAPKLEVVAAQTKSHVLVQVYDLPGDSTDWGKRLYLFPSSSLDPNIPAGSFLEPLVVPPRITSQIDILLGMLSSSRLIFFDSDHWMCSWRVGAERRDRRHVRSQSSVEMVQKHFFLPGDWSNAESLRLCRVLGDGKLLCPNNGEVAVITSELNSAW